ncbi:hypothetical protein F1D05_26500 [Kribbella qitaiheensis]|uniref:Uncharacterized protein n=1 Tax=Kribbella qitaiheensis TaxID=1544730 RepID=A0A7G6X3J9_9ACTN|nr:hypothetical protein [Kribbella qitaiheensis]QNE20814.1 hypothetical protein F1D05_26500 [Kribbella qitaiheensis]
MSELKDLAWSVQESVEPMPFEDLQRRGIRRRRRRQVLIGAGTAVATATAVLAVLLPLGGSVGARRSRSLRGPQRRRWTAYRSARRKPRR